MGHCTEVDDMALATATGLYSDLTTQKGMQHQNALRLFQVLDRLNGFVI